MEQRNFSYQLIILMASLTSTTTQNFLFFDERGEKEKGDKSLKFMSSSVRISRLKNNFIITRFSSFTQSLSSLLISPHRYMLCLEIF